MSHYLERVPMRLMQRGLRNVGFILGFSIAMAWAVPTYADAPALQLAPLEYVDNLSSAVKSGFIDVSNPTDAAVTVSSQVRGFKQRGTDGDLDFFDDPDLASGITVGLPSFELGAREAIRVAFTIDPGKLPHGAIYAAVFFRTVPADQTSNSSYISQSAAVGTLLELNNGANVQPGNISALRLPFWQFGEGLSAGSVRYHNPGHARADAGIRPKLSSKVLPWGGASQLKTGLVLPGTTRNFKFSKPGSYLGLLPVTMTDGETGAARTAWIVACTGVWRIGLPSLLFALLVIWFGLGHSRKRLFRRTRSWRKFKRKPAPAAVTKRPIDTMAPAAGSSRTIVIPEIVEPSGATDSPTISSSDPKTPSEH